MERFKAGQISRIKIKGFMTYDDLEVIPNDSLNLIIGLNGSGKSSIMSAICLGLAGKPQFTGKSAQPSDFIKHGHHKATVEMDLVGSKGRTVTIARTIQKDSRSTFLLNGSSANQTEVMNMVKEYNIDVGNLCQFLPQEKVVEFSKMDKRQRLENMLQSIGEPHMFEDFVKLKQMRNMFNELESKLKEFQNNKTSEVQKNARLKSEVDKHEERKRLKYELNNTILQRTLLTYESLQCQQKELKRTKKNLLAEKVNIQVEINKFEAEIGSFAADRDNAINQVKQKAKRAAALFDRLSKNNNHLRDLNGKVEQAKDQFGNRIKEKINQKARLTELEKQITGLKEQYDQQVIEQQNIAVQTESNRNELEQIRAELLAVDTETERIKCEIIQCEYSRNSCVEGIAVLQNEEDKKMQLLKQRYRCAYDAVCWLQQNRGSFKSEICLPALLSIKVANDNSRKFIENSVPIRDLLTFVCEDPDDVKRLTDILRVQKNLPVNIALSPSTSTSNFNSPRITNEMKELGIECFLNDLFTAPNLVMCYLCKISRLNRVPICNVKAERNVENILKMFSNFYTNTERVSGIRSRYGNKSLSVKRDHIMSRNILLNSEDQSQRLYDLDRQLKQAEAAITKFSAEYEASRNKRSILERKQEQLRAQKADLQEKSKKMQNIERQLEQKIESYKRKEAEVIDEKAEKAKETENICALNKEKLKVLSDICHILKEYHALKLEKVKNIPIARVLSRRVTDMTANFMLKQTEFKAAQKRYEDTCQECDQVKAKAIPLLHELQKVDKVMLDFLMPNITSTNLDDIEKKIVNIQAKLELNCEEDDSVAKEYEDRKLSISNIGKIISELEKKLEGIKSEIANVKRGWLNNLEKHINNINLKFTKYYKYLQCAGEISLDQSDDTDDFPKYGLQIRLKYRADENFMELSQTHHSGGECSVAAIIFILSLQDLTNVPFRCIDEINQGMDSVNERKIYGLIADASKESNCQYFLLTPKLLMDLSFHQDVKVHIIFNSRFLKMKYNLKKHLQIATAN